MEKEKLIEKLVNLPQEIYVQEIELVIDGVIIEKFQSKIDTMESTISSVVVSEKDENGKFTFSNETARKTETNKRCWNNPGYTELASQLGMKKIELKNKTAEFNRLNNMFSGMKHIARLIGVKNEWVDKYIDGISVYNRIINDTINMGIFER